MPKDVPSLSKERKKASRLLSSGPLANACVRPSPRIVAPHPTLVHPVAEAFNGVPPSSLAPPAGSGHDVRREYSYLLIMAGAACLGWHEEWPGQSHSHLFVAGRALLA